MKKFFYYAASFLVVICAVSGAYAAAIGDIERATLFMVLAVLNNQTSYSLEAKL